MPIGTPFHARTSALCESMNWREWAGYFAVSAYEASHEREYNAIRNAAALIDVSPLLKYRVSGRDATRLIDRVVTRDVPKMAVGQVSYTHWCDGDGKVIDDGTVSRLAPELYRWTAAEPNLRWIRQNAHGLEVDVEDISDKLASLALQGPTSREILRSCSEGDLAGLKYFRVMPLLLETGRLRPVVDRVLVVDCPEDVQVARVRARSGLTEAEVRAIMAAQLPRAARLAQADDVIDNVGARDAIAPQVARLDRRYRDIARGRPPISTGSAKVGQNGA